MSIRIRKINGITVAMCAACTNPQEGDVYLDDSQHSALVTKFAVDWEGCGWLTGRSIADPVRKELMLNAETDAQECDATEDASSNKAGSKKTDAAGTQIKQ